MDAFAPGMARRSVEDIVAERIRIAFGDESYVIPVRSIASNERFVAAMEGELNAALATVADSGDDLQAIYVALAPLAGRLLALVAEYDETHVLPPLEELRGTARPMQAIQGALEVWQAVNPFADIGFAALLSGSLTMPSPAPMSSRQRPTAGRRGGSGRNSQTNSSCSTSRKHRNGSPTPTRARSKPSAPGPSSPMTPRHTDAGVPQSTDAMTAGPASRGPRSRLPL